MHYEEVNRLTHPAFDPYSRQPSYKACAVPSPPARARDASRAEQDKHFVNENYAKGKYQNGKLRSGSGPADRGRDRQRDGRPPVLREPDRAAIVDQKYRIVTFCEEPRPAYDRVNLTKFFSYRDPEPLMLARQEWYQEHGITLYVGDKATAIDRDRRVVRSERGRRNRLSTCGAGDGFGPVRAADAGRGQEGRLRLSDDRRPGADHRLRQGTSNAAAVIGGGLLGLEAAKAVYDLALETHVVEFAPRLMPRQVDEAGSRLLVGKIEDLGVRVHLNKNTKAILGNGKVDGMEFADSGQIDLDMVVDLRGHQSSRRAGTSVRPDGRPAGRCAR